MLTKTLKTVAVAGALTLSVVVSGFSFALAAQQLTPTTPQSTVKTTTAVKQEDPGVKYQIQLLFTKDGCSVYEFYRDGVAHTLVTGKTSFCALARQ